MVDAPRDDKALGNKIETDIKRYNTMKTLFSKVAESELRKIN
jgi:hypothetical protein